MVEQREILELIAERTRNAKDTSFRTLVRECDLSPESACGHLKRLWREGLIRTTEFPVRRRLSLGPGESIRNLQFIVSKRGRARLLWYKERDRKEQEEEAGWPW